MRVENSTYADNVWLPTNYYTTSGATNVNATSLNAWAMAMQATAQPQPAPKKKPETAVAWLREQVEEVTQLAA